MIVAGDHQPMRPVREENGSYAVPLHLLSRDEALFASLGTGVYDTGLVPEVASSPKGMETFLSDLKSLAEGQ